MRNEWYGDKRDFLKWPSLLHLAQRKGKKRIFQVAMCTDTQPPCPTVKTLNRQPVECQDITRRVADHFHCRNDLHGIKAVGEPLGIEIEVWVEQFTHATRCRYFKKVLSEIGASATPTVWFFDPDTGIEPESGASRKHVRLQELSDAFKKLPPGDWLACYQHAPRKQDWRTKARTRFSKKLGRQASKVEVFTSNYAKDAIILAVEK